MARLRRNFTSGTITDNPLTAGATTINSANFANLPVVASPDTMAIVLDPLGTAGSPEIAYVTAHTAAATAVTVLRGQETALGGIAGRQHAQGIPWILAETAQDDRLRLLGAIPALSGSPPATGVGPFFVQGGTNVVTTTAGGLATITFPTPFPVGLATAIAQNGDISAWGFYVAGAQTYSASAAVFLCLDYGGAATASKTIRLNWIAIGF